MSQLQQLAFYATPEHDCSYLKDHQATTIFLDPKAKVNQVLYTELSRLGFRRSGNHYYRPHCDDCQACIPIRVISEAFKPSRSQKRLIRKNSDLEVRNMKADFHEDHYRIYERYISERHSDGDMYPPSREQFRSFLIEGRSCTRFIEFSLQQKVLGISVVDELIDGLSAIYTFFDPDFSERSLGSYAVLWQIQEAQARQLPYVYLGYYIRRCQKMNYKTNFHPFEARIADHWLTEAQMQAIANES